MNREHFFKTAKWVCAPERTSKTFSIIRGKFSVNSPDVVSLNVLGLGFFKCYINGVCINPDTFLPLSSEYEPGNNPKGEVFSGFRTYVPSFDITPYVKKGENTIALNFGGGWYTLFNSSRLPKAIWCITVKESDGEHYFVSDETCKVCKSQVVEYDFVSTERHDYTDFGRFTDEDFDDTDCENADLAEELDTEYCVTDCPKDKLIRTLPVKPLGSGEHGAVYDCGINTTGFPVLKLNAPKGEKVTVYFSENIRNDGTLDPYRSQNQQFSVISDGEPRSVQPEFTWFGFRYFEVKGDAEVEYVKELHADIPITSTFDCDNETLNWIYKTFIHTMLVNMHTGHPSDCPHAERRGYTGDGQVTCHAVLTTLGAREFYKKWLCDIADGQDSISGRIHYTAPFVNSGGGPGGWGSAIVEVPYQYYRHYGDRSVLGKYYGNMRKYIDYLDAHSEYGLVTSEHEGTWCLGDWCAPNILYPDKRITFFAQQMFMPAPYVNTYFKVKSLKQMCKIAHIIGKDEDIAEYEEKIADGTNAIRAAYFNTFDGNFFMNAQGANAYAVDLGIERTRTSDKRAATCTNMVDYYRKLGNLDTGIFGTDILIRTLFEHGDGELAVELLTNDGSQGFEHWRRNGATTFHEYWDSNFCRSYNHPMFGAVTAYLFEYLLGIQQTEDSAGYSSLVIAPQAISKFSRMSGSMETPNGVVAVSYERADGRISFRIDIPEETEAKFSGLGREIELTCGENSFELECEAQA